MKCWRRWEAMTALPPPITSCGTRPAEHATACTCAARLLETVARMSVGADLAAQRTKANKHYDFWTDEELAHEHKPLAGRDHGGSLGIRGRRKLRDRNVTYPILNMGACRVARAAGYWTGRPRAIRRTWPAGGSRTRRLGRGATWPRATISDGSGTGLGGAVGSALKRMPSCAYHHR